MVAGLAPAWAVLLAAMLADSARDAHRTLRLLEVRGQAKDHPILLNVPETAYLKCDIAIVSN